jgi:hypothetical protein
MSFAHKNEVRSKNIYVALLGENSRLDGSKKSLKTIVYVRWI